jgi:hypothetical protein
VRCQAEFRLSPARLAPPSRNGEADEPTSSSYGPDAALGWCRQKTMTTRQVRLVWSVTAVLALTAGHGRAQCCLDGLFGCFKGCCVKPPVAAPAYAVAPVAAPIAAPVVAPIVAPVPAAPPPPPQPVTVPVQQVSYVPETCYRTEYQCVPQICYRQICDIDPATGCPEQVVQPITTYSRRAVNVPYTQYRAVYTTKYVTVQPGSPGYPAAALQAPTLSAGAAASPFAAPTTPQAWGAAGADVPPTLVPQATPQPQLAPQQSYQQQIVPQSGTSYLVPSQSLQPTAPPSLSPTPAEQPTPAASAAPSATPAPSLRPIPETARTLAPIQQPQNAAGAGEAASAAGEASGGSQSAGEPASGSGSQPASGASYGAGMPVMPGSGPSSSTGAFPRLLAPSQHTTSTWSAPVAQQPAAIPVTRTYPTALIPTPAPY